MKNDTDYLKQMLLELLKRNSLETDTYLTSKQLIHAIPLLADGGKVRRIINLLRQDGKTIISSHKGYRYTEDITEIFLYSQNFKKRIDNMTDAYNGLMSYVLKKNPDLGIFK